MPVLNRMTGPRGPRFYDEDGKTMFVLVLDGSTRHGPRVATEEDMDAHPEAWKAYEGAQGEFPGGPPVVFTDPPGGPPPKPPARARGAA